MKAKGNEKFLIECIKSGQLEIDDNGYIWRFWKGKRVRAEHHSSCGYLQVRIMIGGIRYYVLVHRLVWQWFNGPIPDGFEINHKDGVKNHNAPSNLEAVTRSENRKHAFRVGLINQCGEHNPTAKLTNNQVFEIRTLYATGKYQQKDLAKQFSIPFQTVSRIVRGNIYPNAEGPISKHDHRHCSCN